MQKQAQDMHEQATDMQKQATDMHEQAMDMHKQVTEMNERATDMHERATDMHERATDMEKQAKIMHEQSKDIDDPRTDMSYEEKLNSIKAELCDIKNMNGMVSGVPLPTRLLFLRRYEREVMDRDVPDRGCSYESDVNDGMGNVHADALLFDRYPEVLTVLDLEAFRCIYGLEPNRALALYEYLDLCDALNLLGTHASRRQQPEEYETLRAQFLGAIDRASGTQLQCVGHEDQGVLSSLWRKVMALKPISNAQV
ncbi:MAG: hypothetical protein M1826_004546 [Phylliscum demangeonii]|nr:MAG: hypothetical protein M1826_004546 [Phylliscum demangeonii]